MPTDDELFDMVTAQRRELADLLESLSADQLDTPSLCPGWTVKDVAAHLTVPLHVGLPRVALAVLGSAGSFDKVLKRRRLAGIRLEATDLDYQWGSGSVIEGTGEALLVGVLNDRRPVLDDLAGEGVALLRSRMAS